MIIYHTERLILTSMQAAHEAELFMLHNDGLVQEAIFEDVPQTTEDVRTWLDWYLTQWRKNGFGVWMVYEKANDGPIFVGRCGLVDFRDTNNLQFGYAFSKYGAGRGWVRRPHGSPSCRP